MAQTKTKIRNTYRRADNGQYTNEKYAKKHPKTTFKETDKVKNQKKPPKKKSK